MNKRLFLVFEDEDTEEYNHRPVRADSPEQACCLYAKARIQKDFHHSNPLQLGVLEYADRPKQEGIPEVIGTHSIAVHVRDGVWVTG